MLIDWITARIPQEDLPEEARQICKGIGDRIQRFCAKTGEVVWTSPAWESIRSDSHQIAVRVGTDLWIQGSPARVMGDGCAVFGSGASRELDLQMSLQRMIYFIETMLGVQLPTFKHWTVSRIDVTGNLRLNSLEEVRDALTILRGCEGGRYRVSQQAGDTVYWSHRSKLKSGKAYAKGPHLHYLKKQKTYTGKEYSEDEIANAEKLLRLELKLGREFFARQNWLTVTKELLTSLWEEYFYRMIGTAEMKNDTDLKQRIIQCADTEGRGKAAYGCWLLIQSEGWERAKESFSKPTWYRHLKVLRKAGLGDADISAGKVTQLRRKIIEAKLITSWDDLLAA